MLAYNSFIQVPDFTWMISMTSLYLFTTTVIFAYTLYEQIDPSHGYFRVALSYLSDETNIFIIYNVLLGSAILVYKILVYIFFQRILEGEVLKITDRLKIKLIDIVFFSYIIELRFDFEVYLVLVLLIFLFVLHTHVALRSEFLVHVHTTSTSLKLHYKLLAIFLVLFFFDYQVLKFSGGKLLSVNDQSEALFLYYMFSTAVILADPFLQFIVDFYEKYTFTHFKNSDEFLAIASLVINIPRLIIQLLISVWIAYKFSQPFFLLICGIDNIIQLKKTIDSFYRIRKLTSAMASLKKVGGTDLDKFHDLTCTVCYDDMKEAVILPCKHIFHEECIRQWIIKNLNHFCPKCKKEFNFDNIGEEYQNEKVVGEKEQFDYFKAFLGEEEDKQKEEEEEEEEEEENVQESQLVREGQSLEEFIEQAENKNASGEEEKHQSPRNLRSRISQRLNLNDSRVQPRSPLKGKRDLASSQRYLLDQPDLSQYPLEFYQNMKKKIIPVGSLPFGLPSVAVPCRTQQHMKKRREYGKQIEVVLRLMNMTRNEQLLFL